MKKLISIMLALVFVFSMATVAFADGTEATANKLTSLTFQKHYVDSEDTDTTLFPSEDLKFTITSPSDAPAAYIGDNASNNGVYTVSVNANPQNVVVKIPAASEYTSVGEYEYTIQETMTSETGSQAVVYGSTSYKIKVQVLWADDAHTEKETNVVVYNSNNQKVSDLNNGLVFNNTYTVGQLDVTKNVTGKLADKSAQFDMTVTFTSDKPVKSIITVKDNKGDAGTTTEIAANSWTLTDGKYVATANIKVSDTETVNITGIPTGVTYKVEEDAKHLVGSDGFDANSDGDTDYTASYGNNQEGTISATTTTVTVTNTKDASVDTGISLDSVPFILILAVCAGAVVLFVVKRRRSVEF